MTIFLNIIMFAVGLVIIIFGGNIFVDASIKIGKKLKIPAIIVGATFVSIATTLPELIVSTISASQGSYGLAVGNAVGSVICNTTLICGLSIAIIPTVLTEKTSHAKYYLCMLAVVLLTLFGIGNAVSIWESIVLFLIFVAFMTINIIDAIKQSKKEKVELLEIPDINKTSLPTSKPEKKQNLCLLILLFIIGAGLVVAGAEAMIVGAKTICLTVGISEGLVGVTVVAIGTSLPELMTTITAIKKKNASLGYGNIIGANILNLTLIISLSGMISGKNGLPVSNQNMIFDFPIALLVTGLLLLPILIKNKTYRWQGICLLVVYLLFLIISIVFEQLGFAL